MASSLAMSHLLVAAFVLVTLVNTGNGRGIQSIRRLRDYLHNGHQYNNYGYPAGTAAVRQAQPTPYAYDPYYAPPPARVGRNNDAAASAAAAAAASANRAPPTYSTAPVYGGYRPPTLKYVKPRPSYPVAGSAGAASSAAAAGRGGAAASGSAASGSNGYYGSPGGAAASSAAAAASGGGASGASNAHTVEEDYYNEDYEEPEHENTYAAQSGTYENDGLGRESSSYVRETENLENHEDGREDENHYYNAHSYGKTYDENHHEAYDNDDEDVLHTPNVYRKKKSKTNFVSDLNKARRESGSGVLAHDKHSAQYNKNSRRFKENVDQRYNKEGAGISDSQAFASAEAHEDEDEERFDSDNLGTFVDVEGRVHEKHPGYVKNLGGGGGASASSSAASDGNGQGVASSAAAAGKGSAAGSAGAAGKGSAAGSAGAASG